jgi:hypothetical protein
MHDLYRLKENLVKELEELGKQDLSKSSLETVGKLAHAAKNVAKVIECCEEEEYSNRGYSRRGMSYDDGGYSSDGNYVRPDGSYRREIVDSSYARGRGRGARRDAMGRYSSAESTEMMVHELRELMNDAPDERTKMEFKKFIQKVEQM